jgi:hypothetical protein
MHGDAIRHQIGVLSTTTQPFKCEPKYAQTKKKPPPLLPVRV